MDHVAHKAVAKEDAVQDGAVRAVARLVVALKMGGVDPVALGSKRHQIQKSSRIDHRIGQSEKEKHPHVCRG